MKKMVSRLLIALMIWAPYQVASAGMIASDQGVVSAANDRVALDALFARAEVANQMQALGIDPASANARVAALTDAEAHTLAKHVGDAPAGGVYAAAIIAVILIAIVAWGIYKERNPW